MRKLLWLHFHYIFCVDLIKRNTLTLDHPQTWISPFLLSHLHNLFPLDLTLVTYSIGAMESACISVELSKMLVQTLEDTSAERKY